VSARSYLSIGDVLSLLRQEFPDVTISKIRFLESQGLVNPERTPSGYRKFYEHDVDRLRWVLRQQREHFLPLKVIKDRLEDDPSRSQQGAGSRRVSADVAGANDAPPDGQRHPEGAPPGRPVLVGQHAAERAGGPTLPGIESAFTATAAGRSTTAGGREVPSSSATGSAPGPTTVARPSAASVRLLAGRARSPVTASHLGAEVMASQLGTERCPRHRRAPRSRTPRRPTV
jgi:DNA-binding transcriptional MerR regulator